MDYNISDLDNLRFGGSKTGRHFGYRLISPATLFGNKSRHAHFLELRITVLSNTVFLGVLR